MVNGIKYVSLMKKNLKKMKYSHGQSETRAQNTAIISMLKPNTSWQELKNKDIISHINLIPS